MIHPALDQIIPKEKRADVNRGIINLIEGEKNPSRTNVFNAYTGKGGLSGVSFSEHANRHEFTQAKQSFEEGQFFTPPWVGEFTSQILALPNNARVLDPCSGHGSLLNSFEEQKRIGRDIDPDAIKVAKYLFPEDDFQTRDIREISLENLDPVDAVITNPPFGLWWLEHQNPLRNEKHLVRSEASTLFNATNLLRCGGALAIVCPTHFPNDPIHGGRLPIYLLNHYKVLVQIDLPLDLFAPYGCKSVSTHLLILRTLTLKELAADNEWTPLIKINGSNLKPEQIQGEYQSQRKIVDQELAHGRRHFNHLSLPAARELRNTGSNPQLQYQFTKAVYHLKIVNPSAARDALAEWGKAHEPAPPGAKYEEWVKQRPKAENVLKNTRKILKDQNKRDKPIVRISVQKNGIQIKGLSKRASSALRNVEKHFTKEELASRGRFGLDQAIQEVRENISSINEDKTKEKISLQVSNFNSPISKWGKIWKNLDWKIQDISQHPNYSSIKTIVEGFYLGIQKNNPKIRTEPLQIQNIIPHCIKGGGLLCWEQGCGKSLASLAWDHYLKTTNTKKEVGRTAIVSSALSIELNWRGTLTEFGIKFKVVKTKKDLEQSPEDCFLLYTHHAVKSLESETKLLCKLGKITRVILDEGDEIARRESQRSRSVLNAFGPARHKLDTTGTPTRNHAGEIYTQLEFTIGRSFWFRCIGPFQRTWTPAKDGKDGFWINLHNPHYGKVYPPFRGYTMFRETHAPRKPTVLGEQRHIIGGDIPNQVELLDFLSRIRTRIRLQDILGRQPLESETLVIETTENEKKLYEEVKEQAMAIIRDFFQGKESGEKQNRQLGQLAIAHAIRLLQQVCSIPQSVNFVQCKTYVGMSSKVELLIKAAQEDTQSHLAIGTIWVEAATSLAQHLKKAQEKTGRETFLFTGKESFPARKKILQGFAESKKACLITTQSSLRSSINIRCCQKVYAEALPWNFAALEQWARRFVRLDNQHERVELKLLVCKDTIEERILGLLLKKGSICRAASGDKDLEALSEEDEAEALFHNYGVDENNLQILAKYLTGEADQSLANARHR